MTLGRKHSEETKRRMSESAKKRGGNFFGPHTEESKKKISEAGMGRKFSKETRLKLSLLKRGSNHNRWIEDRSLLKRRNERNDSAYQDWVKSVKKRDNNTCKLKDENCDGYNIVHHIKVWASYPDLRYIINNGITLCQAHHPRKRAEEKRLEPELQELVSVSSE